MPFKKAGGLSWLIVSAPRLQRKRMSKEKDVEEAAAIVEQDDDHDELARKLQSLLQMIESLGAC